MVSYKHFCARKEQERKEWADYKQESCLHAKNGNVASLVEEILFGPEKEKNRNDERENNLQSARKNVRLQRHHGFVPSPFLFTATLVQHTPARRDNLPELRLAQTDDQRVLVRHMQNLGL